MTGYERYWLRRARRKNGGKTPCVFVPPLRPRETLQGYFTDEIGQVYRIVRCNEVTKVHFRSPMETRTR